MLQLKDVIHVLVNTSISNSGRQTTVTNQRNAHESCQAAQLWRLKVFEFTIEIGPVSVHFLGIFMQCMAIRMKLKTKKKV